MSATLRMGGSFRARLPETSSEESVIEACVIGEEVTMDNDVRMDMPSTMSGHGINERWCRDLTHTGSRDFGDRPRGPA